MWCMVGFCHWGRCWDLPWGRRRRGLCRVPPGQSQDVTVSPWDPPWESGEREQVAAPPARDLTRALLLLRTQLCVHLKPKRAEIDAGCHRHDLLRALHVAYVDPCGCVACYRVGSVFSIELFVLSFRRVLALKQMSPKSWLVHGTFST